MKFFDVKGKEIHKEEFISLFSNCYYYEVNYQVESVIDNILKNGFENALDVYKVLAWKIGKISMKNSTNERFVYHKGWNETELVAKIYNDSINLKDFCEKVCDLSKKIKYDTKNDAQSIIDKLVEISQPYNRIGTVYLLTLFYFITKGKYPIYDSYALAALRAIKKDEFLYSEIKKTYVTHKKSCQDLLQKGFYADYIESLEDIFQQDYKQNRDIDRALWAYGHMFN